MTAPMTMLDYQQENNDLLRQIMGMQNDVAVYKAKADESDKTVTRLNGEVVRLLKERNELENKLIDSAQECSRWKVECLQRRQLMIKAQNESLVRVKIEGVIK